MRGSRIRVSSRIGACLAIVLASLLVASCGGVDAVREAASAPPSVASAVEKNSLPTREEAAAKWRAWQPETKVVAKQYTPEEAERIRLDHAERNRPEGVETGPVPDLVAWMDDDFQPVVDCLRENGFPDAALSGMKGYGATVPTDAQFERFQVVSWECSSKYSQRPQVLEGAANKTAADGAVIYDYFTTYYLDCLEGLGIRLPRDVIPSKEAWIAQYVAEDPELWDPTESPQWSGDAWENSKLKSAEQLEYLCPPAPSVKVLYG